MKEFLIKEIELNMRHPKTLETLDIVAKLSVDVRSIIWGKNIIYNDLAVYTEKVHSFPIKKSLKEIYSDETCRIYFSKSLGLFVHLISMNVFLGERMKKDKVIEYLNPNKSWKNLFGFDTKS